jgi:hypothetical protein
MSVKKRRIRLKRLALDDPGILALIDSDLCTPDDAEDNDGHRSDLATGIPPLHVIAGEVLAGLEDTLRLLGGDGAATSAGDSREATQNR